MRIYVGADNLVEAFGVFDEVAGDYLSDATVTATLYDATGTGTPVAGPATLTYVARSRGNYRGEFGDETPVVNGTRYVLEVVVSKGGYRLPVRRDVTAGYYGGRGS